jgi:Domain of unknown function (DUF4124)
VKTLFFIALLSPALAWAQMYKCVDAQGVTSYSDSPRPGCKGRKVDIQPIPPVSGKTAPRQSDVARQDADFKRRQIERDEADAQAKAQLAHRCAYLRNEHAFLSSAGRISVTDEQGRRTYIDDATRESRLVKLNAELRTCP